MKYERCKHTKTGKTNGDSATTKKQSFAPLLSNTAAGESSSCARQRILLFTGI